MTTVLWNGQIVGRVTKFEVDWDFYEQLSQEQYGTMTPTPLYTRDGRYVISVLVPPFAIPAEVIGWGDRIFVRNQSGQYREGIAWVATQLATKAEIEEDSMSLQDTENASAAAAKAPRVALTDIEAKIAAQYDFVAADALKGTPVHETLERLSICLLVMKNGFAVIGKSAPASADNFNRELGRKFAYEDAIRQLWQLEGYALREKLAAT